MVKFTTSDGGVPVPTQQVPVVVDPVAELDAKVRQLLREVAAAQSTGEDLDPFRSRLAAVQEEWRTMQSRVQQVFTLIAVTRKAVQ